MNVHVDAVQTNSDLQTQTYAICLPTVLFMLPITFLKQMGEQLRELLCILQTIQSSVLQ